MLFVGKMYLFLTDVRVFFLNVMVFLNSISLNLSENLIIYWLAEGNYTCIEKKFQHSDYCKRK